MRHRKFLALNGNAIALWDEIKDYCDEHLTDGIVPTEAFKTFRFAGKKSMSLLKTSCGQKPDGTEYAPLLEPHGLGFKMHDFLEHNDCRDKVLARMAKAEQVKVEDRDRKAAARAAKLAKRAADVSAAMSAKSPAGHPPEFRSITEAVPESESERTKRTKDSSEPVVSEPPVLVFPVVGDPKQPTWGLTQARIDSLQEAYPNVDVRGQCRLALQWTLDTPAKRKTSKGMPGFLFRWMGRAVDRGTTSIRDAAKTPSVPNAEETRRKYLAS